MTYTLTSRPVVVAPANPGPTVRLFGATFSVSRPRLADPRVHVAVVIVSVQVLGQVVIGFDVSIAQILLTLVVCALIEVPMTMWERRALAWPASALLTGNGIALLLRTPGTEHGDWWSMNGWPVFVAAAAIAMFSKYAIRFDGRHLFNPSNLGLVMVFLLFGAHRADPQDLWWGPWSPGLVVTVALIVVGGLTLSWRLRLFDVVAGFWISFAAGVALLAALGHAITARWSIGPVAGTEYWLVLVTSPEIVIFVFFMITDPRTMPLTTRARLPYAVGVAALATMLVAAQSTEYATKVALLAALTVVCATRPVLERTFPDPLGTEPRAHVQWAQSSGRWLAGPAGFATLVVFVTATASAQWLWADPSGVGAAGRSSGATRDSGAAMTVDLDCNELPEVTLSLAARESAASLDTDLAAEVGCDVAQDLVVESLALREGDPVQLEHALTNERLSRTRARIGSNATAGITEDWIYDFDSMELVLLRDPVRPQAVAELGLHSTGTITAVTHGDPTVDTVTQTDSWVFDVVHRLARSDDRFLIRQELSPLDPMVLDG